MPRVDWPPFDRHRSVFLPYQHLAREGFSTYQEGRERPALLELDSGRRILGRSSYGAQPDYYTTVGCRAACSCADLRLLWHGGGAEPAPWLLLERPLPTWGNDGERVVLETWRLDREHGGGDGEEEEEEEEEGGGGGGEEDGAGAALCKGALLRASLASSELRRLSSQRGTPPLELIRTERGAPLQTAANWRWLVLLDMTGVHILDFAARGLPSGKAKARTLPAETSGGP